MTALGPRAVSYERPDQQLRRERAAVVKLRDILATYPPVRKELREASAHVQALHVC